MLRRIGCCTMPESSRSWSGGPLEVSRRRRFGASQDSPDPRSDSWGNASGQPVKCRPVPDKLCKNYGESGGSPLVRRVRFLCLSLHWGWIRRLHSRKIQDVTPLSRCCDRLPSDVRLTEYQAHWAARAELLAKTGAPAEAHYAPAELCEAYLCGDGDCSPG